MAALNVASISFTAPATSKFSSSQAVKVFGQRKFSVALRASAPEDLTVKIEEAKEVCESGTTQECAAAWDEVEEISAEKAHSKSKAKDSADPLEQFCGDNPEADECRTYED